MNSNINMVYMARIYASRICNINPHPSRGELVTRGSPSRLFVDCLTLLIGCYSSKQAFVP